MPPRLWLSASLVLAAACAPSASSHLPDTTPVVGDSFSGGDAPLAGDPLPGDPPPAAPLALPVPRELRGVWIATVANINFPSAPGLSAETQRQELGTLVETAHLAGLNALFFQVRPESDALYVSPLEPWSRFLTGTQGEDPGYDPLATLLTLAHARAIEVHAWLNPYRAKSSGASTAASSHVSVTLATHAVPYGSALWMDPGATPVQDHVVAVAADLLERYDLDGLHFDDYFYPYPNGTAFADDATYASYLATGGSLARDDWRRANVNALVARVAATVDAVAPHVRFGVSPFGIYRPGEPPGITGLDQYAAIFADPPTWRANGWVDYLAPQLYWPSTQTAQAFDPLLAWWTGLEPQGAWTFAGCYLSKLATDAAWTVGEFRTQLALVRQQEARGAAGVIYFQIAPLVENREGVRDVFAQEFFAEPAWTPPDPWPHNLPPQPPALTARAGGLTIDHPHRGTLRVWAIHRHDGTGWRIDRLVDAATAELTLEPGTWAVGAVDKAGTAGLAAPIVLGTDG